jgi:transcriptional regulator with XRE-family HTH domain
MAEALPLATRFGAAVSLARRARGWSQDLLAERVDVSKNHIGYIERGERVPSLDVGVRIARALGLSLDEVFLEAGEGQAERRFIDDAGTLFAALKPELRGPILEMLRAASRVRQSDARGESHRRTMRVRPR